MVDMCEYKLKQIEIKNMQNNILYIIEHCFMLNYIYDEYDNASSPEP